MRYLAAFCRAATRATIGGVLAIFSLTASLAQPVPDADLQALLAGRDPDGPAVVLLTDRGGVQSVAVAGRLHPRGAVARIDSPFLLASVGKPYLAAALLRLADRGALDLEAPIAPLLPVAVVAGLGGMRGVTAAHLLGMTSGLPDYLDDEFDALWRADPGGWTPARALGHVFDEPSEFAPGTGYDYSNTNYLLAQMLLERVAGKPFAQALRTEILAPLGLNASRVWDPDATGGSGWAQPVIDGVSQAGYFHSPGLGDGGVIAPAAEVAAFFRALLIEDRILSRAGLARMLEDPQGEGYGLGLVVDEDPELGPVMGHTGGDHGVSTEVWVYPEQDLVVVLLHADEDLDPEVAAEAATLAAGR